MTTPAPSSPPPSETPRPAPADAPSQRPPSGGFGNRPGGPPGGPGGRPGGPGGRPRDAAVPEAVDGADGATARVAAFARSPSKAWFPTTRMLTACAATSRSRARSNLPAKPARRPRISDCWPRPSSGPAIWPSCPTPLNTASTSGCVPVVSQPRPDLTPPSAIYTC